MGKLLDLTGQRFGRLVAVKLTDLRSGKDPHRIWECQCDCGNQTYVQTTSLTSGNTKSCGCLHSEIVSHYYELVGAITYKNLELAKSLYSNKPH